MLKWLLHFDTARGEHSTGIASINRNNDVRLYKEVGHPDDLYRTYEEEFDDDRLIKDLNLKALIGHNRYATTGAKTADNAHPFHHENIVGAHNGTLTSPFRLKDSGKFEVDSEAIFYNFAKEGFENTINNISGAWALTWFDGDNNTMNFIRNKERTLYYCFDNTETVMYWASMEWMLELASLYSKVRISNIEEFNVNHLYTMTLDKLSIKDNEFTESKKSYEGWKYIPSPNKPGNFWKGTPNFFNGAVSGVGNATNGDKKENDLPIFLTPDVTDDEIEKMKSYIGKEIEFFTNGEYQDELGVSFFAAESAKSGEWWEIRVYFGDNPKSTIWRQRIGANSFTAKVKKVVQRTVKNKPLVYMLLDMRTISEEIPWDSGNDFLVEKDKKKETTTTGGLTAANSCDCSDTFWNPDGEFIGYQGQTMDYEEFLRATHSGCNWCGDTAFNIHAPESLVWIAPRQFVCPICNHDDLVKQCYPHIR